jgi:cell division septation protein DedD
VNVKAELEIELVHQKLDELRENEILLLTQTVADLTQLLKQSGMCGDEAAMAKVSAKAAAVAQKPVAQKPVAKPAAAKAPAVKKPAAPKAATTAKKPAARKPAAKA